MEIESAAGFKLFLDKFCDEKRLKVAYADEDEDPGFYCEVSCGFGAGL